MHDAEIQKAIDDYLEMERKAKEWDQLKAAIVANQHLPEVRIAVELLSRLVRAGPPPLAGGA